MYFIIHQKKWLLLFFLLTFFSFAGAEENPVITWTERQHSTANKEEIYETVKRYQNGETTSSTLTEKGETLSFLFNLNDSSDAYCTVKQKDERSYSICRLKDNALSVCFKTTLPDVFDILCFQEQSVFCIQRTVSKGQNSFLFQILKVNGGLEEVILCYYSQYYCMPSLNSDGDILYCVFNNDTQMIFFHAHDGSEKALSEGSFPVWYSQDSFLYVNDGKLMMYDLTTSEKKAFSLETGLPLFVDINPFSGDSMYLSNDHQYLIYGVLIEDRLLGFISSGYYHKSWKIISLQTGNVLTVGNFAEGFDNVYVY